MPDHVHLLMIIPYENGQTITIPQSVSKIIGQMKRIVSKEFGESIWQKSFYDHVIRDRADYDRAKKYIRENPIHRLPTHS